ncbi:GDSL-type esterase/lipase family protein [Oribacterium sp. FC2011]|uniref:GDSL-type esterase/lipase family protein n=1 Tax=Oribacterium sp. FC2011 TaxID=1408311 RepID=UPI000679800D|nr:GDSL-type esterase/lipase family protein [Oribacterium sp. FC2011]
MRQIKKIAALALGTMLVSGVCSFGSLAAATGISAVDFGNYSSDASAAAGTMPGTGISTPGFSVDDALDQFFQNSVIVGNSIGKGFGLYAYDHKEDPVLKNFQALTANGFSIQRAFDGISTTSYHPMYMGQQRYVWDSIQLMGAKHVYLSFGTTEVQVPTVLEDYQRLINQIKAVNPDVDITVISATYIYPGKYHGTMTSANVKAFNIAMEQICAQNGWGFINVADLLADANGDLNPIYSNDEYIHQNDLAYDIWTNSLKEYALKKLGLA